MTTFRSLKLAVWTVNDSALFILKVIFILIAVVFFLFLRRMRKNLGSYFLIYKFIFSMVLSTMLFIVVFSMYKLYHNFFYFFLSIKVLVLLVSHKSLSLIFLRTLFQLQTSKYNVHNFFMFGNLNFMLFFKIYF